MVYFMAHPMYVFGKKEFGPRLLQFTFPTDTVSRRRTATTYTEQYGTYFIKYGCKSKTTSS